ncbi:methyl-accepting chemotaxis protein [Rummeliibacillus sp. JY-2-4R]
MENKIESLNTLIAAIPVFKAAIPADLSIEVCDLEKFIAYYPGESINLHIQVGQKVSLEEPLMIALKENIRIQNNVPADFYGYEFTGTALPLHNHDGQVIGGIAVQIRNQNELKDISRIISKSLISATNQISNIAEGSKSLSHIANELLVKSEQAGQEVKQTSDILKIIKGVADQTNLLGLNAAIEAARAGDKGRGFEVVANEIRKFSKETVKSTQHIRETMAKIQETTVQMSDSIEQISAVEQEQAASIEQISSFVQEIQEMSNKLIQYAQKL